MISAASQILDLLLPRFQQMTVANGYTNEFVQIKRATQVFSDLLDDLPLLNYFHGETTPADRSHNYERRDLQITLEAYTRTLDAPFTDTASMIGDELETVLFRYSGRPKPVDPVENILMDKNYRGVGEIIFDGSVPALGEGQRPYCGAIISVRVRYNVAVGCPSVLLEI